MIALTITCEGPRAGDLGYLLHKHPRSVYERELAFGRVRVFYPETAPARTTAALLLEIDPIGLVRGGAASLEEYVTDRPYVASSFASVALKEAFASALAGKSRDRPELVNEPLPLRARVPAVRARGGATLVERLFKPLGYEVRTTARPLDERFPAWGEAAVVGFEIAGQRTVRELLGHLYVLLPVLDDDKHYYVGEAEVEKLLAHGQDWLAAHPEKALIASRYLKHRRALVREALSRLTVGQAEADERAQEGEDALEARVRLHDLRLEAVLATLKGAEPPVRRVVDMGCGEGRLIEVLLADRAFSEIVGVDISPVALERAERRLELERRPPAVRERLRLLQGSLLYKDARIAERDALALVEVIEHVEPERLDLARKVICEHLRPRLVVMTTPNAEYNVRFATLAPGKMRHADHRFEWTRAEMRAFAAGAAEWGYEARFEDVGPVDPEVGAPTQMAVFTRTGAGAAP